MLLLSMFTFLPISSTAQSLSAQSLSAQSLSAQSLSAQSLSAQPLSAQSLSAQSFNARAWSPARSELIEDILAAVSTDTLMLRMRELCGEEEIEFQGIGDTIRNRRDNYGANDNHLAADYLMAVLARYGLEVRDQKFEQTGRNVIGLQRGSDASGMKYIICGHYDAAYFGYPGADDNASGTAAVLEAARLLSTYPMRYDVEYILWDAEERGLVGSRYYAEQARLQGDSILGVINCDMISWDSDSDFNAALNYNQDIAAPLITAMQQVNTTYALGLTLAVNKEASTPSDNYSFARFDYPSFLLIEDWTDFNPFYHSEEDLPEKVNPFFFTQMTKAAIGTLAQLADVSNALSVGGTPHPLPEIALHTPSPHPFHGLTALRFTLPRAQHVRIELFDAVGRLVSTIADIEGREGLQQVGFDASALNPGYYLLRMITPTGSTQIAVLRGN
ncbi:M28 family peptidase [bacterium]|nr:M28 family peptidase [bacterium]